MFYGTFLLGLIFDTVTKPRHLAEIAWTALKLGSIGFGGIAGMVGLFETELVDKRKWISRDHYLDVVGATNIIPGPNSVEIMMHCAKERGGKAGLVVGGVLYIVPAVLFCLLWGYLYMRYGHLPGVQPFIYGIRPATTAIICGAVFRLSKNAFKNTRIIILSVIVLLGALYGMNEVVLLFGAGIVGALWRQKGKLYTLVPVPVLIHKATDVSLQKLFFIFLKIGAILYGSGYVLFAYMDDALVQRNHWLTKQQLTDAISAGQVTPGPIFSSATFAGYVIGSVPGALIASAGIFLPSFIFAFFLHRLLRFVERHAMLRSFLDIVNGASVALIAAVALRMLPDMVLQWQTAMILLLALVGSLKKMNTAWIIVAGSAAGYLLWLV